MCAVFVFVNSSEGTGAGPRRPIAEWKAHGGLKGFKSIFSPKASQYVRCSCANKRKGRIGILNAPDFESKEWDFF